VLLIVAAVAVGGCGEGPRLRWPGENTAGLAMSNVAYGAPRSVGSMPLCVTAPGTATITSVALHEPTGNLRIDAFAVRPNPFARGLDGVGDSLTPLGEIGGGFDPAATQQVSDVCPTDEQIADPDFDWPPLPEFAVQVSWSSGDLAGGTGIDVTYELGGSELVALIPFEIWVCAGPCPEEVFD